MEAVWTVPGDSRITVLVHGFVDCVSMNPQLVNVLRGDIA